MFCDPTKPIHEQITEEKWCQNALHVSDTETHAVIKACALGWVNQRYASVPAYFNALDRFCEVTGLAGHHEIGKFNDTHTFEEVRGAFARAGI